ncbi:hypothetical protein Sgou_44770 [Streptomyces gougerotii]|uniref:Uncharacterized protein n=1 Tax=Streptomyces gougerotii TaxID=53448 RepID=A0ABQ1DB77_9ACTN|nr:hypothetical protein Sgou_44770 [Streptomyces gougerotii]
MRTGRAGSGRPARQRAASWAVVSGVQPYAVTIAICPSNASGVTDSARVAAAGERETAWYISIGTGGSAARPAGPAASTAGPGAALPPTVPPPGGHRLNRSPPHDPASGAAPVGRAAAPVPGDPGDG